MSDAAYQNYATLYPKGVQALANNQTWLAQAAAVTYPLTVAEQTSLVNQTMALTRQMDAVIRMLLGQLDVTDGT